MPTYVMEIYVVIYWQPKFPQNIMTALYRKLEKPKMDEFCTYLQDQGMIYQVQLKTLGFAES